MLPSVLGLFLKTQLRRSPAGSLLSPPTLMSSLRASCAPGASVLSPGSAQHVGNAYVSHNELLAYLKSFVSLHNCDIQLCARCLINAQESSLALNACSTLPC